MTTPPPRIKSNGSPSAKPEYRVGRFILRPHRQLLDGGKSVSIGRKALDLLSVLAEAEGGPVTKDELMAAVWPNAIVEDNAIQVHVAALRKVLGPDADLLSTSHGLGYQLAVCDAPPLDPPAPSSSTVPGTEASAVRSADAPPERPRMPLAVWAAIVAAIAVLIIGGELLLQKAGQGARADTPPTIAVLTFQPADKSEDARLMADGLARSIASSLSRYDVTVISASSSLQLRPAQRPQARSLLGADYVVDGRVVADRGSLTVSTQIADSRKNILVYSFDVQGDSALSTQVADRIAQRLALSLDPEKFLDDSTQKFTASDYALIARQNEAIDHTDHPTNMRVSQELAERFPQDGQLQAAAGFATIFAARGMPQSQKAEYVATARADIERAARLAPRSGMVSMTLGALVNGPMALVEQERLGRQAIRLSPAFAPAYNGSARACCRSVGWTRGSPCRSGRSELDPLLELVNGGAAYDYVRAGREAEASQALARQAAFWPNSTMVPDLTIQVATYFGTPQDQVAALSKYGIRVEQTGPRPSDADVMLRGEITLDKALTRKAISNCFETYGQNAGQRWDEVCLFMMVERGALDDAFRFAGLAYPDDRYLYPPNDDRWMTSPPSGLDTTRLFTPKMAPFRNDPRFWQVEFCAPAWANYWQTTQQWPDFCSGQLDTCKARAAEAVRDDVKRKT